MTTYFDRIHQKLLDLGPDDSLEALGETLGEIEEEMVRDVMICSRLPGFPQSLKAPLYKVVVDNAVSTLPRDLPPADFEFNWQYRDRLVAMCRDLHTIFHNVAYEEVEGFGDSPLSPLRSLLGDAWEEAAGARS